MLHLHFIVYAPPPPPPHLCSTSSYSSMLHLQLTGLTRLTKNRDVISLLGGIRLNGSMDRLRAPTSLSDGDGGGQQELSQLLSMSSHCSLEGGGQQQQQGSSSECGLSIKAATRPPPLIVITRHGKTEYNKLGIFTGTRHPSLPSFLSFLLITSHHTTAPIQSATSSYHNVTTRLHHQSAIHPSIYSFICRLGGCPSDRCRERGSSQSWALAAHAR
jgi:hypothetical protein